jgi:hypothetical protein
MLLLLPHSIDDQQDIDSCAMLLFPVSIVRGLKFKQMNILVTIYH